jgi:L-seryl-tRNA(Ser) seleniumtransferase
MVATSFAMPRTDPDRSAALRRLPPVDEILRLPALGSWPRPLVAREARRLVDELRDGVLAGTLDAAAVERAVDAAALQAAIGRRCAAATERRHRRVVNATGVVLHTGLGRAPLCGAAVEAVAAAAGAAIVEVDPISGRRDQREVAVAGLLRDLTGAGNALVVNNNAAATLLMLTALGADREVVISRGELVEIGGGFRVPDVMRRAGCRMVEVGTTNKTRVADYAAATTPATAAWLKVHPSNFRIEGFASTPSVADLAAAAPPGVLVLDDLGSGLLWDAPLRGLEDEPRVRDSLAGGSRVTCVSGDKLLGGPQCGILLGDAALIAACRAHPLYRAVRCDKLTLAALEATLLVYRDGEPLREIPALRMLAATGDELRARSAELASRLAACGAAVVASESYAGSGANPARPLPSFAVALPGGEALCQALRAVRPVAVFARVAEQAVLLDARTLLLEDLDAVAAAVRSAAGACTP